MVLQLPEVICEETTELKQVMTRFLVTRRRALQTAVAAVPASLAGCFGQGARVTTVPTARLAMTVVTDSEITEKVVPPVSARSQLFDRILHGTPTGKSIRGPPLPEDEHLLYDGTVYRLSHEIVERTPAYRYEIELRLLRDDETPKEGESVEITDLPAVDREILARNGFVDEPLGVVTSFVYTDDQRDRSALVPEPKKPVLVWDHEDRVRWIVEEERETTLKTYRYTAERVASATEYGRRVRERFGFALGDLSATERDVVETAIDQEYVVEHDETPSPTLDRLADRFRGQQRAHALDEEPNDHPAGPYVVNYDGNVYWTIFRTSSRDSVTGTPG